MVRIGLLLVSVIVLASCSAQVSKPQIPEAVVKDRLAEVKPKWEEPK